MSDDDIRPEDVARAAEVAGAHEARAELAALAFDAISRQAEGEKLFVGKEWIDARAAEHHVTREGALTKLGNVIEVLERGPESPTERALIAAFAVAGLGDRLAKTEGNEASVLSRFVRHADWLEMASPYAIYAFIDAVLDAETRSRVWSAVADACVGATPPTVRHRTRGRAAARVSALAASTSDTAKDGLGRVARHAQDPSIRALGTFAVGGNASVAGQGEADGHRDPASLGSTLHGRIGRPRRGSVGETLRIVFGIAAAVWVARMLGALVGLARTRDVSLGSSGLSVISQTRLLGRVVRSREETFSINGLAWIAEASRYPVIHALVGLTCLGVGILGGGLLAFDAIRSGETWALLVAAGVIVIGAGADLALEVLFPKRKNHVALELGVLPDRTLRIDDVPASDVGRFLEAVKKRFA